ncbi:hypothetical protein DVR12_06770 [Chitinophaga silvatica]|uniref:Uncharacterized protein n=1 Tax=Chitinophaga silvatica TaxID=2282649 RepID=A0A3E1YE89_9BACT|nr:hypothetical protein [Chitinophaga silvatica]RFS24885.1 hypothetical protein DVR12_06770 [Chitinophaga silvatica]
MRTTRQILSKIFTQRFYVENLGFFLVLFYLLFGTVNGANLLNYHLSLIRGFLNSTSFLLIMVGIWTAYALKCTAFVMKTLQSPGYDFLYTTMGSIPTGERRRHWLFIQFNIYLPVLIYAGIAIFIAISSHKWMPAVIIGAVNIINCVWPLLLYEKKLWNPDTIFFIGHIQRWLNKHFTKPPVLFFIYELLINFPLRIISTKLASTAILWLTFLLLHRNESFDLRGLQIGVIVCALLHMQLMIHHRAFDDTYLSFMENLPIPVWRHYSRMVGVYLLLFLPEILMIICNAYADTSILGIVTTIAIGLSLLVIFRSFLYFPKMNTEIHIRYTLSISFIVLFMILAHYEWIAILLMQLIAAIIFFAKYRKYEAYIESTE